MNLLCDPLADCVVYVHHLTNGARYRIGLDADQNLICTPMHQSSQTAVPAVVLVRNADRLEILAALLLLLNSLSHHLRVKCGPNRQLSHALVTA